MDIYWGEKKSNKRRYEDLDDDDFDEPVGTITKKIKLFKDVNKMIYSIKNEVHFTDQINNQTIENVIKIVTKLMKMIQLLKNVLLHSFLIPLAVVFQLF
jgi:hypothetical protein